jgi:hypothetical protein
VLVGPYWFAQPGLTTPEEQAQGFYDTTLRGQVWDLAPALDLEQYAAGVDYDAWAARFFNRLRALTGNPRVVLYSSKSWFTGGLLQASKYDNDVILWVARYYKNDPTFSTLGFADSKLAVYQYWNKGTVPGIAGSGNVDMNYMEKPLETLRVVPASGNIEGNLNTTEVELYKEIIFPASLAETTLRIELPGSLGTHIVVRTVIDGQGNAIDDDHVSWFGNIFAWGSDSEGVGNNPAAVSGYVNRVDKQRSFPLPGALWADVSYSSKLPVRVEVFG